jgi:hypothetical protein
LLEISLLNLNKPGFQIDYFHKFIEMQSSAFSFVVEFFEPDFSIIVGQNYFKEYGPCFW